MPSTFPRNLWPTICWMSAVLLLLAALLGAQGGTPSITVTSPAQGATVPSGIVVIEFAAQNFTLGDQDQTHLHFYVDADTIRYDFYNGASGNSDQGVQVNGLHTHFVHWRSPTSIQMFGVAPGAHQVRFVLAQANHTELANPEATQTRNFTVSAPPTGEFTLQSVLTGLNFPLAVAFAPDGRLFFNEWMTGHIHVVQPNFGAVSTFFTVSNLVTGGERGLLGLALDPDFATNHFVYAYFTTSSPLRNKIIRLTDVASAGTNETVIVDNLPASGANHNGGVIQFGPDGKLYVVIGDVENTNNSQNTSSLAGKILRYNKDGTIPSGNPFGNTPVWAYGLRNSFGFTFHPHTGDLWETENGPDQDDEINRIVAGGNYGWPNVTGIANNAQFIDPIVEITPTIAPTGIVAVGENSNYPERYHNNLLFTDFNTGRIRRIVLTGAGLTQLGSFSVAYNGGNGFLLDIDQAPDGFIYVSSDSGIFRLNVPGDTTAPTISSVASSSIATTGATIAWTTNEASDTQVEYGTTTSYGSTTTLNASMVTSHSVNLSELTAGTLYHYRVRSRDAAGNLATSADFTFTTAPVPGDTTPPTISGANASGISTTGATINWTTNEASDTQVEYGTTTSYGASSALNTAPVTSHSVTLSGLLAGTLYHYRVKSRDAAGNLATSADFTFTTTAAGGGGGGSSTVPDLKVAFIADQGAGSNAVAVLNLIKNEGAHMVIHSGDFDYGSNPTGWDDRITSVLGANYPYFASVGNHDVAAWPGYQQKLQARLALVPEANCTGDLGVQSPCRFRGLFFLLSGAGTMGSGHDVFLRDQLASDDSVWSLCSWHKNQKEMQIGGKSSEVGWGPYEECRIGGGIIATGHEHSYERTKTLINTQTQTVDPAWTDPNVVRVAPGATFVFVSGLGGKSVRNQDRCLPTTYPYGCNGEWAKIYASDQGATHGALFITFNVDGDPRKARGEFKNIRGETIDTFTILADGAAPPLGDTTAPVISAVSSSSITSIGATITWTTNEASDSQVEYGTSTSYGGNTTLDTSLVTNHSATINGLTANTLYHYRARSRDAAGNLGSSADFTFTTAAASDTIAPTVNLTAPSGGTTVRGTINVTANASDSVGVSGVQFLLDGVNLGSEDTSSPFQFSWNTLTATNGSHTLTAVARDAAGNSTPSSVVSVTVDNAAPTVSISSPAGGTTVSGTINVTADAADNLGVAGVQFKLNGANLGTEDTAVPFQVSWSTTTALNGSHTLTAVGRDPAGNQTTSLAVPITVANNGSSVGVTLTSVADSYIRSDNLNKNYGTSPELRVRLGDVSNPITIRSYLKFTLSGLSGTVKAAKLRLWVTDGSTHRGITYSVSDAWTETGITWGNAPPPGTMYANGGLAPLGTWVEIDLPVGIFAAGNRDYSFVIVGGNTNSAVYSSRQGASPPQLVLTLAP